MEFIDWNEKTLDELTDFLEIKHRFNSTPEAKAIIELTAFYRNTKITDQEANEMVNDFIDKWAEMNPTLDKNFYWSGVNDGFYMLLNKLRGNSLQKKHSTIIKNGCPECGGDISNGIGNGWEVCMNPNCNAML